MSRDHECGHDRYLQYFTSGKNGVAMGVTSKHSTQHTRGDGEVGCAKKHPGDANGAIRSEPGQSSRRRIVRPRFVFEQNANHTFDEIGRASCRERVKRSVVDGSVEN